MGESIAQPMRASRGLFQGRDTSFWLVTGGVLLIYLGFIVAVGVTALANIDGLTFRRVLCCENVLFAIRLSLFTATVTTFIALLLAIPSAYALSQYHGRGKIILDTLLDLPLVLPPIGLGFLLLIFLRSTSVGDWFVFEVPGIILAQFTVASGFAVRVFKSTFDSLNPRYEEVARTLGFSRWQAFSRIVLPLSKNGLMAGTVLTWARCMGDFGATVIVAGAFPMKTEVLPIAIFLRWETAEIAQGLTVTIVLITISLMALLLFRKIGGRAHV